jgi:hypothetical protein
MGNDELAKQMIMTILNGSDLQKIKPFNIGAFQLNPLLLKNVASRITSGDIKVKYDDVKYKGWAEYDIDTNTFYLGFSTADNLSRKALIVHESTHAYFDMLGAAKMKVGDSEAAAYLAQCEYASANNPDPSQRLTSDKPERDKVFEVAWGMAGKLLGGTPPTPADFDQLRDAVSKHPFYNGKGDTLAGFNGVPATGQAISSDPTKTVAWPITYEEISGSKHFQILPGSSVANGTLSILKPTNTMAILRVTTQDDGTMTLLNTTMGDAIVAVVLPSTLIKTGFRLVSGSLADSLSDDFSQWRSRNRRPKLNDLVFPQLHFL